MEAEQIRQRIAGREAAVQVEDLIGDLIKDPDFKDAFLRHLYRSELSLTSRLDVKISDKHPPIARLGTRLMPFGEHKGKSFDETPLEYLDWLCQVQEQFLEDLRSYLKHPELEGRRT